jgi:hypothetical protein
MHRHFGRRHRVSVPPHAFLRPFAQSRPEFDQPQAAQAGGDLGGPPASR